MKRLTVMDFAFSFDGSSDDIPVVVREGINEIAHFPSIGKLSRTVSPGIAERKISFVTLTRERMIIQVRPAKITI